MCGIGVLIGVLNLDICVIMKQYRNMCYVVIFKQRHSYFCHIYWAYFTCKGGHAVGERNWNDDCSLACIRVFSSNPVYRAKWYFVLWDLPCQTINTIVLFTCTYFFINKVYLLCYGKVSQFTNSLPHCFIYYVQCLLTYMYPN